MADDWEAEDWEAEDFKPKLPAGAPAAAAAPQFETAGEAILARATGPDDSKFAGEDEEDDEEEDEAAAGKQPAQVCFWLGSLASDRAPPVRVRATPTPHETKTRP